MSCVSDLDVTLWLNNVRIVVKKIVLSILVINFFGVLSAAGSNSTLRRTRNGDCFLFRNSDTTNTSEQQQNKMYAKSSNRADRQTHVQINKTIHQPRKHNHEPRCNNRRNQ